MEKSSLTDNLTALRFNLATIERLLKTTNCDDKHSQQLTEVVDQIAELKPLIQQALDGDIH